MLGISDEQLADEFQTRPFLVVRKAANRMLGMLHFDFSGNVDHQPMQRDAQNNDHPLESLENSLIVGCFDFDRSGKHELVGTHQKSVVLSESKIYE
ncbi:hypothetical protein FRX31_024801, partial [Thalictrum thalictroides]